MGTEDMKRMQTRVAGAKDYSSSQMCICDYCGFKTVASDGSCKIMCPRCGAMMREHTGMKIDPMQVTPSDAWDTIPEE